MKMDVQILSPRLSLDFPIFALETEEVEEALWSIG